MNMHLISPNGNASVRDFALKCAAEGIPVIPIPSGQKGPTMKEWQRKATTDPDKVSDFFPEGARQNLGLVMGNGLVAFDVDDLDALARFEAEHGPMPRTPTQRTGSGKRHYLFRLSGGVRLGNRTGFLPGFDIKSDAGQIVGAPSVHPNGGVYQWEPDLAPWETPIAEMPAALLAAALKPEPKVSTTGCKGSVKEGGRNVALTREAGRLRARGAGEDEVRSALVARNATFLPPLELWEVNRVVASSMTWEPGTLRYTANDHGLATRFIDELGDDLRFIADEGLWLIWNGNIWERDETGRVVQLFLEMARAMLDEAEAIPVPTLGGGSPASKEDKEATRARDKALGWAKQAGEHKRINSALKVAQTEPRVVVTLVQLDAFPGFLPVANGVVELATGVLRPNAKEMLATRCSPYAYRPEAKCPRWERVIARALPGELGRFMKRVLGYALMGNPREQAFFMLCGQGADSKSTIARVLTRLLVSLVVQPAGETFLAGDGDLGGNAARADLMAFRGARIIVAPEPDSRRKLDAELAKRLTGQDLISARAPYGRKQVEFEMTGVILMLANHLPGCDEADEAIWRRLKLIPFDHPVPEAERDGMLVEKLVAEEAEGILCWLIEGARLYQQDGLQVPDVVRQRTAAWRRAVGRIERFVNESCVREGSGLLTDIHRAYRNVCLSEQVYPLGLAKFGARLAQLGFTIERAQAGEVVIGLRSRY